MMGFDLAALLGALGLGSAFALVGVVLAGWMCWRIADKAGLPGWTGLGAILLTLTGIGSVVSLILLWVFAFMRWPRDGEPAVAGFVPPPGGGAPGAPPALPPPAKALSDRRGWKLTGNGVALAFDDAQPAYLLTGEGRGAPGELVVADPSVGRPHARLLTASGRLGLEDLGAPGGTFIDGARLLPGHGPRDITAVRALKLGNVVLALSRS
ncbi:MAG: FHA domain-containing protein [Enhydrobacter sp.]|nr:FHA domain-containing protein [Enhydrobacter sp.]